MQFRVKGDNVMGGVNENDETEMRLYEDESGQLSFQDMNDNYFPVISDYGKIPNRFIEKYGNIGYIASLSMALALQNVSMRHHSAYAGTQEELFFEKIYKVSGTDWSDGLISCIPIRQFIKFYGLSTGGKTYQNIDRLFNGTLLKNQWQILYEDEDVFVSTSVLTGTMYDKRSGCLYMKFNKDLEPLLSNIQRDYAQISLKVLGRLKEDYITNLYQIFKKRLDAEHNKCRKYNFPVRDEIEIEFSMEHLMFLSGIYPVDLTVNDVSMQKVIELLKIQDYRAAADIMHSEKLIEKYSADPSRTAALRDFNYFKRRFLDKLFRRINGFDMPKKLDRLGRMNDNADRNARELFEEYAGLCRESFPTDIHFRYETVKAGRGGKVSSIIFYISKADWSNRDKGAGSRAAAEEAEPATMTLEHMRVLVCIDDMVKGRGIDDDGIMRIARAAGWNTETVRDACAKNEDTDNDGFLEAVLAELAGHGSAGQETAGMAGGADVPEAGKGKRSVPGKKSMIKDVQLFREVEQLFSDVEPKLTDAEITAILREAAWDRERVMKAYRVYSEAPRDGVVGFMRRAIRDNYEPSKKSGVKKNDYSDAQWNRMLRHQDLTPEEYSRIERIKLGLEEPEGE